MSALNKVILSDRLVLALGIRKVQAKKIVDLFFAEIARALAHGEQVKLSSFGNFNLRDKSERPGRNPKTGAMVTIPERRVVTFHVGHKLRSRITKHMQPEEEGSVQS